MPDQGVTKPSSSLLALPVLLMQKKDEMTRFCVDYRKLSSCDQEGRVTLGTRSLSLWAQILSCVFGNDGDSRKKTKNVFRICSKFKAN